MGWCSWNFRLGPFCLGMTVLGAFGGAGQLAGKLGTLLHSRTAPSSKKRARSVDKFGSSPNFHPPQTELASSVFAQHVRSCHIAMFCS